MNNKTEKPVLCVAEERGSKWEALCLNYDIAVQGETFEEVFDKLSEAIRGYYEYVEALPESERNAFLNRRMPLLSRLRFAAPSYLGRLFRRVRGRDAIARREFTLPCHV